MTRLKDHQAAMVELLAHGSALSASGARMSHALHDVLALLNDRPEAPVAHTERRSDATTSGLNDALLASDVAAVRSKSSSAEQRVKQLENTINQLRASREKDRNTIRGLTDSRDHWLKMYRNLSEPEQAGCRIPTISSSEVNDAAWSLHDSLTSYGPLNGHQFNNIKGCFYAALLIAMNKPEPEQSGVRKEDTEL